MEKVNLYAESYAIETMKNLAIELFEKHGVKLESINFYWDDYMKSTATHGIAKMVVLKEIEIKSSKKIMKGNEVEFKVD